mgnify:CR=1 FL=1
MQQALIVIEQNPEKLNFYLLDADTKLVAAALPLNDIMVGTTESEEEADAILQIMEELASNHTSVTLPIQEANISVVIRLGIIM